MIFDNNKNIEAFKFPLNWGVDYNDGSFLMEFDETGQNDYYSIRVNDINRFGLYGQGLKLYYQNDGSFMLNNQLIELEFHNEDGEIFNLTSSFFKKDCISYKQAFTDFKKRGISKSNLESICFGYKTIYEKNDTQFYFKPIVNVPVNEEKSAFLEIQLTSNKDMIGKLVIKNKNKVVKEYQGSLRKNYAWLIEWTIN